MISAPTSVSSFPRRGAGYVIRRARAVAAAPPLLRDRLLIESDLRRLRREHGRALDSVTSGDGPVALFASLSTFVYQLKHEGMLAKALQLEGCRPVALVPRRPSFARRYFRSFGVDSFVFLDDYIDPETTQNARVAASELLEGVETAEDLKRIEYLGAAVGRQVLATASRSLHSGRLDLTDERVRSAVEQLLPAAIQWTLAAESLLAELEPALVLFLEKAYGYYGPLFDRALERNIDVLQFSSSLQADDLVFKRYTAETRGLHPRSLSESSWARVRELDWTPDREAELVREFELRYTPGSPFFQRNQGWTRPVPPADVLQQLQLDPAKRTAVLFSHVLWDANVFYGQDLFADQGEWFVETIRAASENDRVNWIVKLHPANVWKLKYDRDEGELDELVEIRERLGTLPSHVALLAPDTPVSTRSIFELASWGVTIRGSVGVELPCFGVPVLTAGTGYYSGRGFTVDSPTAEAYLERLRTIETIPPLTDGQVELARRHAYALFQLRPTRFTSFSTVIGPAARAGHPFDFDVRLNVRNPEDMMHADDLRRFARWAVHSQELDYLDLDAVTIES